MAALWAGHPGSTAGSDQDGRQVQGRVIDPGELIGATLNHAIASSS